MRPSKVGPAVWRCQKCTTPVANVRKNVRKRAAYIRCSRGLLPSPLRLRKGTVCALRCCITADDSVLSFCLWMVTKTDAVIFSPFGWGKSASVFSSWVFAEATQTLVLFTPAEKGNQMFHHISDGASLAFTNHISGLSRG